MKFFGKPQPTMVRIQANIVWQFAQDPESGEWIGVCQPLNLNALGDTYAEVQACASEAVELLLHSLLEANELEAFLRRHGWRPMDGTPQPADTVRFDIPYDSKRVSVKDLLAATA